MKKRQFTAIMVVCALAVSVLAGCGSTAVESQTGQEDADTSAEEESAEVEESAETTDAAETSSDFVKPAYAETEYGWLYGYQEDSTYIFKGIQYGVVEERFMPAAEPESWSGVKAALAYGETCPNTSTSVSMSSFVDNASSDMVQNEQCLYLNVWTQSLETDAQKPVIFFIHGGGYTSGASNELACYDGKNISEYGDVVYVNVNHRLNYLGYTDLSAYGEEYATTGDVGIQDLVMALQWVQDNIENFGGDPSNVTIVGQSGGGYKVALLMSTPEASDLFTKAMICSGTAITSDSVSFGITQDEAQAAGVSLVEKCKEAYGLSSDEEAITTLQTISYEDLVELAADTGTGTKPTIGNDYIPEVYDSETGVWPEIAADKTLIVTNTFGEFSGSDGALAMPLVANMMGEAFDPDNPDAFLASVYKPDMTEDDMIALVEAKYGEYAETIIEQFETAFPSRDIVDVTSLNPYRQASIDMCIAKAEQGGAAVYNCIFAYEYPFMGGLMNYHTGGDIPLFLYNLDTREFMIEGDEETAYKVSAEAASALVNYAYTGDPSTDTLTWTAFTEEEGATMIFDDTSEVINYPDQQLLQTVNEALAESGSNY